MRNSNDFDTLNNPLEIRCKCDDLRLPKYAHLGDAGADLRADIPGAIKIWPHESAWIDTGVCVETIEKNETVVDGLPAKQAYLLGQIIRYCDRAGLKDEVSTDLGKANNYAHRLVYGEWRYA